jgi:CheY-like chemotaxis protein
VLKRKGASVDIGGIGPHGVSERPSNIQAAPRVLIVDDDPECRRVYATYLRQKYAWEVIEIGSGVDALNILDASFHAVVLDEMMPGMRGMQVLQRIRRRADLEGICVIMLTATTDAGVIAATFEHSPNAYLLKMSTTPESLYVTLASKISETTGALRPVNVFLCHSNFDKPAVRELYFKLSRSFVNPWFDEQKLIGGQDWEHEIRKAVKQSDIVMVCLSQRSVTSSGYLHKEIRFALDAADERPEGAIFIIPLLLEPCDVPARLARWQWIDYTREDGWDRVMQSVRSRAKELRI